MQPTIIAHGIHYYPQFVSDPDCVLADVMAQVQFTQRARSLYGRSVATPRMEAWHGAAPYRFGGSALPARELPSALKALAVSAALAISLGTTPAEGWTIHPHFDTCLANLYRDGSDSVAWHSDDEPEMGDPVIASISLGAPRDFLLRRIAPIPTPGGAVVANKLRVTLEHGSLLVMHRGVQSEWQHSIPKRAGCTDPRVNLTFRDCTAIA